MQSVPSRIQAAEALSGKLLQCGPSIAEEALAIHCHDETIAGCHLLYGQSGVQAGQATIGSLAENQSTLHVARYSLLKV